MSIKSIALVASTLVLSTSVNAAIISTDWQTAGDNLITEDTVNGLQWLDLTVTQGLSYNDVAAQLGAGGTYEGFSFATRAQVVNFFDEFGGVGPYNGPSNNLSRLIDNGILDHWGVTSTTSTSRFATFRYVVLQGDQTHQVGFIHDPFDPRTFDTVNVFRVRVNSNSSTNPGVGSVLVRDIAETVVPVPAAAWLFGSGLLGLIGVARRKVRA